jgi:electron transport complex protein RnfB
LGRWDLYGEGISNFRHFRSLNNELYMDPLLIKLAIGGLAVLGAIGLLFGIGLALAAHKFAVETNPKIEEVKEILAGAQ